MTEFLKVAVDFVWGLPLLVFIFTANIILVWHSRFLPLKGLKHAVQTLLISKNSNSNSEGQLSQFQSFCNAIAATVGLGNISGVAIAISIGGPGALFWMWVAALFGMNTKFFECTIAQFYRGHDYRGEIQGGAMYVIEKAMPKGFLPLGYMFAVCGMVGTLGLFQINQLAQYGLTNYGVSEWITGITIMLLTAVILMGGLRSIARFCSITVPVMSVLYFLSVAVILIINIEKAPEVFSLILREALNPSSAFGGITGYGFLHILSTGMKRATFSNEAGIGTAPMAHSNSKTDEPISEGYVAMLGPLLDTIIVCSLTAFTILVTFPNGAPQGVSGIDLTTEAFTTNLGDWGRHFLAITITLFALSTIIGMANYGSKCWNYLFKGRWGFTDKMFLVFYSGSILIGALLPLMNVINIMDIAFALMTVPNIIATVYLAKKVKLELELYNRKNKL